MRTTNTCLRCRSASSVTRKTNKSHGKSPCICTELRRPTVAGLGEHSEQAELLVIADRTWNGTRCFTKTVSIEVTYLYTMQLGQERNVGTHGTLLRLQSGAMQMPFISRGMKKPTVTAECFPRRQRELLYGRQIQSTENFVLIKITHKYVHQNP